LQVSQNKGLLLSFRAEDFSDFGPSTHIVPSSEGTEFAPSQMSEVILRREGLLKAARRKPLNPHMHTQA
jgi:hypothetical protein